MRRDRTTALCLARSVGYSAARMGLQRALHPQIHLVDRRARWGRQVIARTGRGAGYGDGAWAADWQAIQQAIPGLVLERRGPRSRKPSGVWLRSACITASQPRTSVIGCSSTRVAILLS